MVSWLSPLRWCSPVPGDRAGELQWLRTTPSRRLPRPTRFYSGCTARSARRRFHDPGRDDADPPLGRRYEFIDVWRPIRGPLRDAPLAMCDARSVSPGDLVASDLIYHDRKGEIYLMRHNPKQC
jgi:hypothetical protein